MLMPKAIHLQALTKIHQSCIRIACSSIHMVSFLNGLESWKHEGLSEHRIPRSDTLKSHGESDSQDKLAARHDFKLCLGTANGPRPERMAQTGDDFCEHMGNL